MSTDSALGKGLNVMTLGLYRPVMKALFPGQKSPDANINTDPGQTSTYGAFITRTHGTIGQSGNIIWLEGNALRAVVKKAKKSGKGGGATAAAPTVTYFATFAVGLCEGPIAGVRRIWVGPDLVYDAGSDDLESIIASNLALKNFKIYLGTDTQAPNSRIQADRGAANTPTYPGLAYIVVTDLALAKYGNSIQGAQIKVEVVNAAAISEPRVILSRDPQNPGERVVYSGGGITQTAEYLSGVFGVSEYVGRVKFRDYETSTWRMLGEYVLEQAMPRLGVPATTGNMGHGYIFGKKSSFFVTRNIGSDKAIMFYNSAGETAIAGLTPPDNSSGSTRRYTYANGSYWLPSAASIFQVNDEGITEWPDAGIDTLRSVVLADSVSGSLYIRYKPAAADSTRVALFLNDPSVRVWSSEVSASSTSGSAYFYVDDGRVCVHEGGQIRVYDTGPTGLTLAGALSVLSASSDVYFIDSGIASSGSDYVQVSKSLVTDAEPLLAIIESECARSNLIQPTDIDATGMVDSVIGFRVTASGNIRNALEPLRAAFPFDAYQSGYKIRFRSRGTGSVVTIPIGHLIADTQLEESREMDSQLPQRVTVQYLDRDRDYDQNEQSEERLGAESVDEQSVSIQVVMTAAHAKQTAEKLLYLAWLERYNYRFKLPPIYSGLEPSDVITIAAEYTNYELLLASANPDSDGVISCAGVPSSAAIYTSAATADAGQQAQVAIPLSGASVAALLDIPVVDETVQNAPGFVAAITGYTGGWAGGTVVRSADDGQTWEDVQGFSDKCTFGYAQAPLGTHAGNLVQRGGSLIVSLLSGFVDGVTEAQMFGGSNTAAYGAPGRWEIIRFQNAALNADGSYTLGTFWRCDKGTEWATGLHQSGDLFVLLNDPDNAFVGMSQDSIGQPRTYRAVTFDADIDSASDIAMTYTGVNLECLSPCHPSSSRDGSANLTAKWVRRTRAGGAWRDNVDASLGETSEAYEIDVMSGGTVKRTLTSSTQSVIYTAANQVTDFGSTQASITLCIYQLSSVVGRGYPLEATF
jgi:hypothetical protein